MTSITSVKCPLFIQELDCYNLDWRIGVVSYEDGTRARNWATTVAQNAPSIRSVSTEKLLMRLPTLLVHFPMRSDATKIIIALTDEDDDPQGRPSSSG